MNCQMMDLFNPLMVIFQGSKGPKNVIWVFCYVLGMQLFGYDIDQLSRDGFN